MKLEEAESIANEVVNLLNLLCERIEIAGSIRRGKSEINDIDIVLLPKPQFTSKGIQYKLENAGAKAELGGKKMLKMFYKEKQVDIYIAERQNFEVLFLIRTGSALHNQMLCQKALNKGLKMNFTLGLINKDKNVVANTEKEILENLLGKYIEPKDREV